MKLEGPRATLVGACVAFALALVAFAPALRNGFVLFDDPTYVTANPVVRGGLTLDAVRWAFTTFHFANYHPLTWLSHCLDVTLFGLDPAGHHATSVLLHATASALLVCAGAALTLRPLVGFVAGVLFAVHPQHVESVAWISERKDVLSAVAFAGLLWAYAAAHRRGRPRLRVLALALFVLGLLAKPMLVTVPALLLVIDVLLLRRAWSPRLLLEKVPFAVAAAVFAALTLRAQRGGGALTDDWTFAQRTGNAFVSITRYVAQTIWPSDLSPYYVAPLDGWPAWAVLGAIGVVGVITAAAVGAYVRRRIAEPLAGWLWFCGMLIPVLGLVKVGLQSMADRYTYLPHVGLFLIVGVAVDALVRRGGRRAGAWVALVACAIVAALVARTWDQIGTWRTPRAMWVQAIAVDPDNAWAHYFLADVALGEGDVDGALASAREAAARAPWSADILERLGLVELIAGNHARAEGPLRAVIAADGERDHALFLLGETCRQTGRPDEARAWFARAADAARKRGHAHLAARAQRAFEGGDVTDLSAPALPVH